MDRQIIAPGQLPLDTDLLNTNKNVMLALGDLMQAVLGTSTIAYGLAVTPTSPATLNINVAPGSIYAAAQVDATAYGSLSADTADTIVKQGILLSQTQLALTAPTTAGYSVNYLIEAAFNEVDGVPVLLPFYNATNPQQPYNGPGGNNQQTNTRRQGQVALIPKAGIAAATGTQTTPSADPGYIPLAVVTVAYGQTQIVAGNITAITTNVLPTDLLHIIQGDAANYAVDTGTAVAYVANYTPAITALVEGMPLSFRAANTNPGSSTLNVNGIGPKSLVSSNHNALKGGEILAGSIVTAVWNANANVFELQSGQQTGRKINVQIFTSSGTYTPTPGTTSVEVEVQGGGGGGGGSGATSSSQFAVAGGGGSGAYAKSRLTSGFTGGIAVTVGAGGAGGPAGNNVGSSGGTSSFGALISCQGGPPGANGVPDASGTFGIAQVTGMAALATGGNLFNAAGRCDTFGIGSNQGANVSGAGCASNFGAGGRGVVGTSAAGIAATSYGSGGGGACANFSAPAFAGGNGAAGVVIITEYA